MEIDFTPQELLFVYGECKLKVQELNEKKSIPNYPISSKNIDSEINLYSSIAKKISDSEPNLLSMNPYLDKIKN